VKETQLVTLMMTAFVVGLGLIAGARHHPLMRSYSFFADRGCEEFAELAGGNRNVLERGGRLLS
jgi:hypothetical protein